MSNFVAFHVDSYSQGYHTGMGAWALADPDLWKRSLILLFYHPFCPVQFAYQHLSLSKLLLLGSKAESLLKPSSMMLACDSVRLACHTGGNTFLGLKLVPHCDLPELPHCCCAWESSCGTSLLLWLLICWALGTDAREYGQAAGMTAQTHLLHKCTQTHMLGITDPAQAHGFWFCFHPQYTQRFLHPSRKRWFGSKNPERAIGQGDSGHLHL